MTQNPNKLSHYARNYGLPLIVLRTEREILRSTRGSTWGRDTVIQTLRLNDRRLARMSREAIIDAPTCAWTWTIDRLCGDRHHRHMTGSL